MTTCWLDRLPTIEEVEAHAAAYGRRWWPCDGPEDEPPETLGLWAWRSEPGKIPCVGPLRIATPDDLRMWSEDLDAEWSVSAMGPGQLLPLTVEGLPVALVAEVERVASERDAALAKAKRLDEGLDSEMDKNDAWWGRAREAATGDAEGGGDSLAAFVATLGTLRSELDAARAEVERLHRRLRTTPPWPRFEQALDDEQMRALQQRWSAGPEAYQGDADALIATVLRERAEVKRLRAELDAERAVSASLRERVAKVTAEGAALDHSVWAADDERTETLRRVRVAIGALGVADCDDPIAALEALAEDVPRREAEALDGRNAAVQRARSWLVAERAEVERLGSVLRHVATERDRLQRACDDGLPREVILCPACGKPHAEGPRHDDPTKDGRTRPHHTHRCYLCGHVWDAGRWTFGVEPGGENEVTKRLRAEGREAGLREALEVAEACVAEMRTGDDLTLPGTGAMCVQRGIEKVLAGEVTRG